MKSPSPCQRTAEEVHRYQAVCLNTRTEACGVSHKRCFDRFVRPLGGVIKHVARFVNVMQADLVEEGRCGGSPRLAVDDRASNHKAHFSRKV